MTASRGVSSVRLFPLSVLSFGPTGVPPFSPPPPVAFPVPCHLRPPKRPSAPFPPPRSRPPCWVYWPVSGPVLVFTAFLSKCSPLQLSWGSPERKGVPKWTGVQILREQLLWLFPPRPTWVRAESIRSTQRSREAAVPGNISALYQWSQWEVTGTRSLLNDWSNPTNHVILPSLCPHPIFKTRPNLEKFILFYPIWSNKGGQQNDYTPICIDYTHICIDLRRK